jgi:hypothetical protein
VTERRKAYFKLKVEGFDDVLYADSYELANDERMLLFIRDVLLERRQLEEAFDHIYTQEVDITLEDEMEVARVRMKPICNVSDDNLLALREKVCDLLLSVFDEKLGAGK